MMRQFFVEFGDQKEIMSQPEFANFIATGVFQNRDIRSFVVLELDNRLTPFQAASVAQEYNLANEVIQEMKDGHTPLEALLEWVK